VKRVFWRNGPWVLVRLQSGVLRVFEWKETNLTVPTFVPAPGGMPVLLSPQAMLDLVRFLKHRENGERKI
jgi:hypothetical protein